MELWILITNIMTLIIAGKQAYLNFPFFFIRALAYIFGWWYASKRLIALSRKEDIEGGLSNYKKV